MTLDHTSWRGCRVAAGGKRWGVGAAAATLAVACSGALAQDTPAVQPAPPALSGPSVEPEAAASSLVRLGYDGRLERVEDDQPEVAALALVELDEDVRSRIEARLEERAAFLDGVVIEHYRTLLELYTAFGAGDEREVIRLYVEFSSHLAPLFEGGGLGRQLAAEMGGPARRAYTGILRDYYAAVVADATAHPAESARGPGSTPAEILRNYKIELLMQEVGRSFARIIDQKTQQLEEVLSALQLTPEREAEVRAMVQAFGEEVGLNPTPAEQREFFVRLMGALSPEERQRLMVWVLR